MKTNTVTLFLSTGIVIQIPRLSDKKLVKLTDIIDADPDLSPRADLYTAFKHEDTRYYIKPNEVSMYTIQTEKVHL